MKDAVHTGFTLIELSIVLVIIGLVVGGVLSGRDLIHVSEVRRVITQRNQIDIAVSVFRMKYNCLPGDCAKAAQYWSASSVVNGNANGVFDDLEGYNIWNHLSLAQMINGSFNPVISAPDTTLPDTTLAPKTALQGVYFTVTYDAPTSTGFEGNYLMLAKTTYINDSFGMYQDMLATFPNITQGILTKDAFAIDQKIDDGRPLTGKVVSSSDTLGANGMSCVHPSNGQYYIQFDYQSCYLWIALSQ